jgi:hypothetical protein
MRRRLTDPSGQALVLSLGVVAALLTGGLVLVALGQAVGAKSREQRAADLAAVSAAAAMRRVYPRLFEPAFLPPPRPGLAPVPNPRHLTLESYAAIARGAAVRGAARNGADVRPKDVGFPGGGFAPTRVRVRIRDVHRARGPGVRDGRIEVAASAVAELAPDTAGGGLATGGGYSGPLAYRQGKPMRPDVAAAFDRMAAAAEADGVSLVVSSAFRGDAEQARLWAANPDPKWVAPPGTSLHRLGTELDLGPPAAYGWLAQNAERFGFVQRYRWEPWHYGYARNAGSRSVGFGPGDGKSAIPDFVPERFAGAISRAAQRWNVSAALISAQLYAESNFNPFAQSPAGAQGIAQFMPGTARSYALSNPFDADAAIDAQAHLMRDLLRRFASVPLALAAYNAGPGAVAACGCVPPYPETRAYVAKILGLLGGAGELGATGLEVKLVA